MATLSTILFFIFALGALSSINLVSAVEDHSNSIRDEKDVKLASLNLIYDFYSKPFNISYSDWTANWWKWTYSIPWGKNPSYDDTGKYCNQNQAGPVWFLTLSFEHPVVRTCEIPQNTALLITLLNSECSYAEFQFLKTEQELRSCAKSMQDAVNGTNASLDGFEIPKLEKYRIQTNLFNFTLPENNILNLTSQTTQSVADGNWLFLKPLTLGKHELIVKGNLSSITNTTAKHILGNQYNGPIGWNQTTTYILLIK